MTVTPVKNTEDPRVKRTRQLLRQAFDALLAEKPFEAISVQDITERATVNRGTFYTHYQDKFDLAEHAAREIFQSHLTGSVQLTSPLTEDILRRLCLAVFDFLVKTYSHCKLDRQLEALLEGAMHDALSGFIVDWLGQDTRDTRARRPDLAITAQTISSAFIGAGLRWIRGQRTLPKAELTQQIVAVLAPGVLGGTRRLQVIAQPG
jgi:AcrR family transcriptional regulator